MCTSLGKIVGIGRPGEPLVGWRTWRLELDPSGRPALRSVTRPVHWDREIRSNRPPRVLDDDRSGIHAYHRPRPPRPHWSRREVVSGEVVVGGMVVVHEHGYRAEWAEIRNLVLHPCGLHGDVRRGTVPPGAPLLLGLLTSAEEFCGCSHGPHLSSEEMELVRSGLADRYGVPVEIAEPQPDRPVHRWQSRRGQSQRDLFEYTPPVTPRRRPIARRPMQVAIDVADGSHT